MFYPASDKPLDLFADARLVWMVNGKSDKSSNDVSWSPVVTVGGLGYYDSGGGSAIADINGNGKPDLLLMGIDNPGGANSIGYKIGWDLSAIGYATSWSGLVTVGGLGYENAGGGAAIADINGNGKPDLLLMAIDNPAGANSFGYKIGWDLNASGSATSWSGLVTVGGLGYENAGGGAAIADIDGNGKLDLLLMAIDNPAGTNSFQYKIGWDLSASGSASRWSGLVTVGGLGPENGGGGAAIADIDRDGKPDLLLMGIDNPDGANSFWYRIVWDLRADGSGTSGSPIMTSGGLGYENAGGGAAIADINGDGKLDLLLMGIDDPAGANSFWYKTGWDIQPQNRTLAKYKEDFMLTGLTVEENFGCDAGLFYTPSFLSGDPNQTLRSYLALRYEFLNSQNTLSQGLTTLTQHAIIVGSEIRHFSDQDAALKELDGSMIAAALLNLPSGRKLPIALAMADNSATEGMDSLVSGSYILGDSYNIDMTAVPQMTWKSIKLLWYNTTTRELLDAQAIVAEVDSWGWSDDETANISLLLLAWSLGETNMTRYGADEVPPDTTERDEVLSLVTGTLDLLDFVRRNFSYPLHSMLLIGIAGPTLNAVQKGFPLGLWKCFAQFIKEGRAGRASIRETIKTIVVQLGRSSDVVNTFNPLRRAFRSLPKSYGKDARPLGFFKVSASRFVRALKVVGIAMVVISVLVIIGEFFYMAAKGGWTGSALMTAGLFAAMELIYLAILVAIGEIPYVGWAISLVIVLIDVIASAFGYGSAWVMEKIIGLLTDYDLRSDVDLETRDTWVDVEDYDDNGITQGDRIEVRSRIRELVSKTSKGYNQDVVDSYITPVYQYYVPNASNAGSFTYPVTGANLGPTRWADHDTGVWFQPASAQVNLPVAVWLQSDYKIYYDQIVAGVHTRKSYLSSSTSDKSTLYFDVLPPNIHQFGSGEWTWLSSLDKDGDGLANGVESIVNPEPVYRIVNKNSGLSLGAAVLGSNVQVSAYESSSNQMWKLSPDLAHNQVALKAWNGKYAGLYSGALATVADNYNQGLERFRIIDLGDGKVALKASNGWYVSAGQGYNPDQVMAITGLLGAKEKFELVYQDDGRVALKAWNGRYVSADLAAYPGKLMAVATQVGDREKFWIAGSGYYQFYSRFNNGVFSIDDGSATDGANVVTKLYTGSGDDQRWTLESVGEGYYKIVARHSGKVLGISGAAVNGANVVQETYSGSDDQKWKLDPVMSISNPYAWDTEADGLSDGFEARNIELGASSASPDTDGDGLFDGLEVEIGTSPASNDTDGDGLTDYEEYRGWQITFTYNGHTFTEFVWPDPLVVDSDGDGLADYEEYLNRLNPRSADTDGNGTGDADEVPVVGMVAVKAQAIANTDTDGDGLTDLVEEAGLDLTFTDASGSHTVHATSDPWLRDTDFDGLSDGEESNLLSNPRAIDTDGDGLNDLVERGLGTNIALYDTDSDGLDDGTERTFGSDPRKADTDGDGLNDRQEVDLGSSPVKADSDGDWLSDSQEVAFGSNPNKPDSDEDLLLDNREYALGTDPNNADSDQDTLTDGYEVIIGTNPLNKDSDGEGMEDGEEVLLWSDPLKLDSDHDGLTDFQEVHVYSTNPLSADSDNDGINDSLDPDTTTPIPQELCVLYDEDIPNLSAIKTVFSQYPNMIHGTLEEIPNYQDMDYVILLGNPSAQEGTVGNIVYNLLSEEERQRMLDPHYRFAARVNVWPGNKLVVILTQPQRADRWRVFAFLKNLRVELVENSIKADYPFANNYVYVQGEKWVDTYLEMNLSQPLTPSIKITRYSDDTTPHPLDWDSGLAPDELPVGKYIDIWVSENVQSQTIDNLDNALFKIHYTALDLDRTPGKDGDSTDPDDIDETTLSLYRWDEGQGKWIKVTPALNWVNDVGVNTTNLQSFGKLYEGYVWADVDHFSLYALAGRPRNPNPVPNVPTTSSWGSIVLAIILGGTMVWLMRRRQNHKLIH